MVDMCRFENGKPFIENGKPFYENGKPFTELCSVRLIDGVSSHNAFAFYLD